MRIPLFSLKPFLFHGPADTDAITVNTLFYPGSTSWPMGFAWSSAAAQDCTLGLLQAADFPLRQLVAENTPAPTDQARVAAVATDDVMFFHKDRGVAEADLRSYDQALRDHGVPRAQHKDISACDRMVAIGCEIRASPPTLGPEPNRLGRLLLAIRELACLPRASPRCVWSMLGTAQWFVILARPIFSIFEHAYGFVRLEDQHTVVDVPRRVVAEFLHFAALSPLLITALDRPFSHTIIATDAAPEFGFGVSVCNAPIGLVRQLARKSEKRGDYVRLHRASPDGPDAERPRIGTPVRLGIGKRHFHSVISCRARHFEHSGSLELKAVLLAFRWLARSSKFHSRRLVMLIDAKAALCACAKGRSGSPVFRKTLLRIAAFTLSLSLLPRFLYIPSEDNPADDPSRGVTDRSSAPWW